MKKKKKLTQKRAEKAMKAFVESEERQQTPEQKREAAWFPMHIKSIMEDKDNVCYTNGVKTGRSIIEAFGWDTSDAHKFAKGLKMFYSGVVNAIEAMEAEAMHKGKEDEATAPAPENEVPST